MSRYVGCDDYDKRDDDHDDFDDYYDVTQESVSWMRTVMSQYYIVISQGHSNDDAYILKASATGATGTANCFLFSAKFWADNAALTILGQ